MRVASYLQCPPPYLCLVYFQLLAWGPFSYVCKIHILKSPSSFQIASLSLSAEPKTCLISRNALRLKTNQCTLWHYSYINGSRSVGQLLSQWWWGSAQASVLWLALTGLNCCQSEGGIQLNYGGLRVKQKRDDIQWHIFFYFIDTGYRKTNYV